MNIIGQFLLNLVMAGTQLAAMLQFAVREKHRKRFSQRVLLCAVVLVGFSWLSASLHQGEAVSFLSALLTAGMFALTILGYCLCCGDPPTRAIYNIFSGILLRLAASSLANFPLALLPDKDLGTWANAIVVPLTHLLISVALLLILEQWMIREIRENPDFVPGRLQLGIMVAMIALLLGFHGYVTSRLGASLLMYGVRAAFCLMMFSLFYVEWKQAVLLAQSVFERRMDAEKLRYGEEMNAIIQAMNIKAHDLRHQIRAMQAGTVVTPEVISELTETVRNYENHVQTGNPTLDVLLTETAIRCEAAGISCEIHVKADALSFITPIDLNALFGNAIDNAVEYLKKLPKEERLFWITCGQSGGFIKIRFENRLTDAVSIGENGVPATTKADRLYHGFGTQSILQIAQKYGGHAVFTAEDQVFAVCVVIPAREDDQG